MTGPAAARIDTERLILVPLAVEHADEMADVLDDPQLHTFIGGAPLSRAELRARYARLVAGPPADRGEGWLNWVVRQRDGGKLVGTVQATVVRRGADLEAALAWVIGTRWQGRGFAGEAARALAGWFDGYEIPVVAYIHPDHLASAAVASAAGFVAGTEVVEGEIVWRRPPAPHGKSGRTTSSSTG